MTPARKEDKILVSLFRDIDSENIFKTCEIGFHYKKVFDVDIEYGFSKCSIYLPIIWKKARRDVLREILSLAYDRINGMNVPTYGPKALAYLKLVYGEVPDSLYAAVRENERPSKITMATVRQCNLRLIGSIDPDTMYGADVDNWGRDIYAVYFKKAKNRSGTVC